MPIAFVAGATGYTGRALLQELARHPSWRARPQARAAGKLSHPDVFVADPRDAAALEPGVRGTDAVVQLIGTVRKNFADGDYEAIDYGTTVALLEAARRAGVPRFLLLSSVGAGRPIGSYLRVKRRAEEAVQGSGLRFTIVRPSVIGGPGRPLERVLGRALAWSPKYRGIEVSGLARVFVRCLERPEEVDGQVLEGASLWRLLEA